MEAVLGAPQNWIAEWKFDGIRAQLVKRGANWRLWSRGEELISDAYPDLEPLQQALPPGVALDGELVVLVPPPDEKRPDSLDGLAPFASLQQRLGRKVISEKTLRELPVALIAYDLLELDGHDLRGEPQRERRAKLERLIGATFADAAARPAPAAAPEPGSLGRDLGRSRPNPRAGAPASARGADAEGARGRLWGRAPQGRRPHRRVVEVEARSDERRRGADLRRARPRPPLRRLQRLHLCGLERRRGHGRPRAGAVRQGLFRPLRRRNARDGRDHPQDDGRDLRSGAQRHSRPRCSSSASRASRRASATRAASRCAFPACCAGGATSRSPRPTRSQTCARCCRRYDSPRPR